MLAGGLPAATMEAIAERAGVSKATIYKWWPSRGAVALEGFMVSVADSWSLPEELPAPEALYVLMRNAVRRDTGPIGPVRRFVATVLSCITAPLVIEDSVAVRATVRQLRDRAQGHQVLDRLVRRSIRTQADRIMREDVQ